MPRRFRDAAGALAALLVLFAMLMVTSPPLRTRVLELAGGPRGQWLAPGRAVSDVVGSAGAVAISYAADNSYMVFFLIIAGLLFILMLRT